MLATWQLFKLKEKLNLFLGRLTFQENSGFSEIASDETCTSPLVGDFFCSEVESIWWTRMTLQVSRQLLPFARWTHMICEIRTC